MPVLLETVAPAFAPCKCCGTTAQLYGVVDFNKHCNTKAPRILPVAGIPVYYHRCPNCQFIFTVAFDDFTPEDYARDIYNKDYILVDPDYKEARAKANAAYIAENFRAAKDLRILDYGGGAGQLAEELRREGFTNVDTYDPFVAEHAALPAKKYECIVSFEVMEHSPTPRQTVEQMNSLLDTPGVILFTTLTQPVTINQQSLNWWYAAPRNGHISLYSSKSLSLLTQKYRFYFGSLHEGLHLLWREMRPPPHTSSNKNSARGEEK